MAAAVIAYQADSRANKAQRREAEAVAIAIGGRVRSIANGTELSAQFMQGFLDQKKASPKDSLKMDAYIIDFAAKLDLPELTLTADQITALSHTDSNAAVLLTACSDRRVGVEADANKFTNTRPGELTDAQLTAAQIMPYHLREMGKACKASFRALEVLVPELPEILGPIPSTVGEMVEAEKSALNAREHGSYMKFLAPLDKTSGRD